MKPLDREITGKEWGNGDRDLENKKAELPKIHHWQLDHLFSVHLENRRKPFLFLFLQFRFNGLLKPLKASLIEQLSIHENSGGSWNIRVTAIIQVPINESSDGRVFEVLVEPLHVQTYFPGDPLHFGIAQIVLVGEQFCMDFPKLALLPCGECGYGCLPGIIVARKGKVFNHQFHIIRVFLQHLLEVGLKPRTVGSLIVIENGNGDRSLLRPFKRQARQVKLINGFKPNNLEGILRTARKAEQIGPR